MNILVIGATGQIGYAVTKMLCNTNYQVSVLVRNQNKLHFPDSIKINEQKEFNHESYQNILKDIDCVIYSVGLPEQFIFDDRIFEKVNCKLFEEFLEALKNSNVKNLIYISTYEVFKDNNGIITETDSLADETKMTPYYQSMTKSYKKLKEFSLENKINLTTIHPAAIYGGLNTGDGFTNYIDNLFHKRFWKVPVIINGRFPVIHADSLANAINKLIGKPGTYLISDQMTSLKELALMTKKYVPSFIPITIPLCIAKIAIVILEFFGRLFKIKPIMSMVQLEFITKGWEPKPKNIFEMTDWKPMPLNKGIQIFLESFNS
jgi:nucleoside-diphosphate-sugar epimerase